VHACVCIHREGRCVNQGRRRWDQLPGSIIRVITEEGVCGGGIEISCVSAD